MQGCIVTLPCAASVDCWLESLPLTIAPPVCCVLGHCTLLHVAAPLYGVVNRVRLCLVLRRGRPVLPGCCAALLRLLVWIVLGLLSTDVKDIKVVSCGGWGVLFVSAVECDLGCFCVL